jgi:hypothetical protein
VGFCYSGDLYTGFGKYNSWLTALSTIVTLAKCLATVFCQSRIWSTEPVEATTSRGRPVRCRILRLWAGFDGCGCERLVGEQA